MSIGITQLIVLVLVMLVLFGNIPKLFKDLGTGITVLKQTVKQKPVESKVLSTEVQAKPVKTDAAGLDGSINPTPSDSSVKVLVPVKTGLTPEPAQQGSREPTKNGVAGEQRP
jgi:Sec-independent protein translocase protein TatA